MGKPILTAEHSCSMLQLWCLLIPFGRERGDIGKIALENLFQHIRVSSIPSPAQFQQIHPVRGSWRQRTRRDLCCSITFCLNFGSLPQKHPYESIPAGSAGSARLNAILNCLFHSAQRSTAVLAERRKRRSVSHESRQILYCKLALSIRVGLYGLIGSSRGRDGIWHYSAQVLSQ